MPLEVNAVLLPEEKIGDLRNIHFCAASISATYYAATLPSWSDIPFFQGERSF